jgi:hypothetical protein
MLDIGGDSDSDDAVSAPAFGSGDPEILRELHLHAIPKVGRAVESAEGLKFGPKFGLQHRCIRNNLVKVRIYYSWREHRAELTPRNVNSGLSGGLAVICRFRATWRTARERSVGRNSTPAPRHIGEPEGIPTLSAFRRLRRRHAA